MIVDFYYLTALPLERVLPSICEKVLAQGGRMVVVAEAGLLARIDEQLWTYARESFLPHGRSDPEHQPILLAETPEPANGATHVALADGEWREAALEFERAFYFFDPAHLEAARAAWRSLKDRPGAEARYWKQDERGKWVQGP
ncbi:MAG: polymerase subunit chi [Sphingomonadales bacterium]|jgi:DNA polymerase-3 subunit chi|nr:polymerase subunit chi [Sphingomonadales bacterium]